MANPLSGSSGRPGRAGSAEWRRAAPHRPKPPDNLPRQTARQKHITHIETTVSAPNAGKMTRCASCTKQRRRKFRPRWRSLPQGCKCPANSPASKPHCAPMAHDASPNRHHEISPLPRRADHGRRRIMIAGHPHRLYRTGEARQFCAVGCDIRLGNHHRETHRPARQKIAG